MTAPAWCVLCSTVHGRARRALPPAEGVPALCITCRASCDRGDGAAAAEAARRNAPPPDAGAALLERLATWYVLEHAGALPSG